MLTPQEAHYRADDIILEALNELGAHEITEKYRAVKTEFGFEYGKP